MALMDYRKLCPRSGRALTSERDLLRAQDPHAGPARTIRCECCGRLVDVCPDPGTGRALIYSMHLRSDVSPRPDRASCSR